MRRTVFSFSVFLGLASCLSPITSAADLGDALPGGLHVGALVNLRAFLTDFPELRDKGFLASRLDDLVRRGFPDPREHMTELALGGNLAGDRLTDGLVLGAGPVRVVPHVRLLAREQEVELSGRAYRGVAFVRGAVGGRDSEFADLTEDTQMVTFDQGRQFPLSSAAVDTLGGAGQSFSARHGRTLDSQTYYAVRVVLDKRTRKSLSGQFKGMAHMTGLSLELTHRGDRVVFELRAAITGGIKARIAAKMLDSKLAKARQTTRDPAARRMLEAATLERSGKTLILRTEVSRAEYAAGLPGIEALLNSGNR